MLTRILRSMRRTCRKIIGVWLALQVELQGYYSIQRIQHLQKYSDHVSWCRVASLLLLTPIPAIIIVVLTDTVPLADPFAGIYRNYVYWCRNAISSVFISVSMLLQFRSSLPRLQLSTFRIAVVTIIGTIVCTAFQFVCALVIGFPLPFGFAFSAAIWTPTVLLQLVFLARNTLRHDAQFRVDFLNYLVVFFCQVSLTFIYPTYISIFTNLRGHGQTAFFFVLPMIKIATKNCISRFLPGLADAKPETVIFNVEIFHALYVACALQNVKSRSTIMLIMTVDLALVWVAMRDASALLVDLTRLVDKASSRRPLRQGGVTNNLSYLRLCCELLNEPTICNHPRLGNIRVETFERLAHGRKHSQAKSQQPKAPLGSQPASIVPAEHLTKPRRPPTSSSKSATIHPFPPTGPNQAGPTLDVISHSLQDYMSLEEKVEFVAVMSPLLFMIEFAVLIEFTEVIVPIMYAVFLAAMSQLPNRNYYPQFGKLSPEHMITTIQNVLTYSTLEFISFVLIIGLLTKKLHFSPLYQLVLVLDKQWLLVQSKLILWTVFIIQYSLLHFGADFSMKFAWLRPPHPDRPNANHSN